MYQLLCGLHLTELDFGAPEIPAQRHRTMLHAMRWHQAADHDGGGLVRGFGCDVSWSSGIRPYEASICCSARVVMMPCSLQMRVAFASKATTMWGTCEKSSSRSKLVIPRLGESNMTRVATWLKLLTCMRLKCATQFNIMSE